MVRLLLVLGAILWSSVAQAHGTHTQCLIGDTWMGVVPHYHPGGTGAAVACGPGAGQQEGYRGGYDPRYREQYDPRSRRQYDPRYDPRYQQRPYEPQGPQYEEQPGYQGQPGDQDQYDPGYAEQDDEASPPPPYYGGDGGYPRPGDDGPQTNEAQDCYNVYGNRMCCPKGWTVQDGRCAPYRGR